MKYLVTRLRANTDTVLLIFDLAGVFVFAVEGALAAMKAELDVFGLLVLSFATALGGGMLRDLLIGATPPNAIKDWRYGTTAFAGGAAVFCFSNLFQTVPVNLMLVLDAAGLSLCAVAGVTKALDFKINGMLAVLMGALTGVGGGTLRDLMLARVPNVLKADIYAVAAIVGATVIVLGLKAGWTRTWVMLLGGMTCFVLRMVAVWEHWNLPKVMVH
jgi:uncharacterized membrane protein YeiH